MLFHEGDRIAVVQAGMSGIVAANVLKNMTINARAEASNASRWK